MSSNNKSKTKFNPKQFEIKIDELGEGTNRYYNVEIKDKVTYVTYYSNQIKPDDLHSKLKDTFKEIHEYRVWWKKIMIKEGHEVCI